MFCPAHFLHSSPNPHFKSLKSFLFSFCLYKSLIYYICDRLWKKQAFGLKISCVHFSLELINNNLCLKCWKNYYSIFMGSRDMNFIMLFYSEVQFQEKRLQGLLI